MGISEDIVRLLGLFAGSEDDLGTRRRRLVEALGAATGADAGSWSWGRGHPAREPVVPAALIDFGMTAKQRTAAIAYGLSREFVDHFQMPILKRMVNPQAATLRADLYSDDEWRVHAMRKVMQPAGHDEWLHVVRYCEANEWASLYFVRRRNRPAFSVRDRELLDLALQHVGLLQTGGTDGAGARPGSGLPLRGLTPRQREVMLLLLEGQARKQIASSLGISAHTVNEHVKALFRHFKVRSITSLAAKFLRNRGAST